MSAANATHLTLEKNTWNSEGKHLKITKKPNEMELCAYFAKSGLDMFVDEEDGKIYGFGTAEFTDDNGFKETWRLDTRARPRWVAKHMSDKKGFYIGDHGWLFHMCPELKTI